MVCWEHRWRAEVVAAGTIGPIRGRAMVKIHCEPPPTLPENGRFPTHPWSDTMTKPALLLLTLSTLLLGQAAHAAAKPCDELKAEIAAKLDEKGVKNYEIAAVENDKVGEAKVIGSCEGGTKKLTYVRK